MSVMSLVKFLKRCLRAINHRKRFLYTLWGIRSLVNCKIRNNYRTIILKKRLKNMVAYGINLSQLRNSDKQGIINDASKGLEDYHTLFGSEKKVVQGSKWNIDYRTGYTWEIGKPYTKYKIIDYSTKSDVKFAWDASRGHNLLALGEAYLLTKEEKYACKIVEEISSFIDENPFMHSINWTCSMDVAIRAVNWVYAMRMINDSPSFNADIEDKARLSLAQHIFYIEKNLEKGIPYSGNHYIADLAGLLHLYLLFDIKGRRWSFVYKEFLNELKVQVLESGVHYEKSTSYQRLVLEMLLYTVIILKHNSVEIPEWANNRLIAMTHFLDELILADGSMPLIGDNDNGRFLPFIPSDMTDYRYLIDLASDYYTNEKYINVTDNTRADGIMLGIEKGNRKKETRTIPGKLYQDAGFCFINDGHFQVVIHNAAMSRVIEETDRRPHDTHTHFDLLSFTLAYDGVSIITDPGTYCYTSSPENRLKYRSTPMHNTVCVNGLEQQESHDNDLFLATQRSFPTNAQLLKSQFEGSYEYRNDNGEVVYTHDRQLLINDGEVKLIDEMGLKENSKCIAYFHLGRECHAQKSNENYIVIERGDNLKFKLSVKADHLRDIIIKESTISPEYGVEETSEVVEVIYTVEGNKLLSEYQLVRIND